MEIDPGSQGYGMMQGRCEPGGALARAVFQNLTLRFHNSGTQRMIFWVGQPSKGFWGTML
eukprot:7047057-Pyramimonas_sp.AAC.1